MIYHFGKLYGEWRVDVKFLMLAGRTCYQNWTSANKIEGGSRLWSFCDNITIECPSFKNSFPVHFLASFNSCIYWILKLFCNLKSRGIRAIILIVKGIMFKVKEAMNFNESEMESNIENPHPITSAHIGILN